MSQTKVQLIEGININTSAPADSLVIDSSGNVGVGNSSPVSGLDVTDSVIVSCKANVNINDTVGGFVAYSKDPSTNSSGGVGGMYVKATTAFNTGSTPTYLAFYTHPNSPNNATLAGNAVERMRITNTGVGIGITSPGVALHVDGDIRCDGVYGETDTNTSIQFPGSDVITFNEGGSEAARIDSSGRFLVGTSNADTAYGTATLQISTEGDTVSSGIFLRNSSANAYSAQLRLGSSRGSKASPTVVSSGDVLASIHGMGYDGSAWQRAASIDVIVDSTPGTNDMPGRLVFSTTADSASSPTERMRIDSNGQVQIGRTSPIGNERLALQGTGIPCGYFFQGANSNVDVLELRNSYNQSGQTATYIRFADFGGTTRGSITATTSATAYNTSSDYRLKENVVPLTGAVDRLNQLQVHRFNFIEDPDKTVDGFLAHEAQSVVPECVTGTKDEVEVWKEGEELPDNVSVGDNKLDEDNNTIPVYQGIDQSKLVPLLTAALQEALAEIESLKARLTAAGI